jgi:hypothetical protein
MKKFWDDNKVLILGLAGAVLLVLQQLTDGVDHIQWPAVGLAVGVAAAGYVGKNWRGQASSIIGIIGNVGYAIDNAYTSGHFTWLQVGIQLSIIYASLALPDGKSRGYEQSPIIKAAKVDGEIIQPAALTSQAIKKEAAKVA